MAHKFNITKSILILLFISIYFPHLSFSQEVPGGVGSTNEVNLWLRAEDNILNNSDNPASDGEEIKSWTGISGNTFSATKGTNGPIYTADGGADFNNLPVIEFDNTDRYLSITDDDELDGDFSGLSIFIVYKGGSTDTRSLLMKRDGYNSNQSYGIFYNNGYSTYGYLDNNSVGGSGTVSSTSAHISSFVFNGSLASSERLQLSLDGGNTTTKSISFTDIPNYSSNLIIGKFDAGDTRYLNGDQIAEIFMIKSGLNDAQRVIVENYFEAKYPGITLANDYFSSNPSDYYHDVIGVGRFNGDEHTESAAAGLVLSFYDGTLDNNGEFVLAAHNNVANSAVTDSLEAGIEERWSRNWYIEKTTAGTLNATISFDFGDGIGGQFPQSKSDYVLLKYNSVSGEYEDVGIADANKNVSGDRMVFNVTDAELADGIYTLGTTDKTNSPVIGSPNKTWYSYQSGNWSDATTWTLDGAATPLYVNPGGDVPSPADFVYITNGRTVTIQNTTNNLTVGGLDVVGRLDLTSSTGHSFTTITGDGVIKMEGNAGVDNYPAGDNTGFADAENGGKLIIYGSGITLNQAHSFNEIEIEMDNSSDIVTHLADYTINGDIRIIKGIWQINDNASTTDLNITINGDLTIESLAEINVGTANARHQLNLYADLDNDGGRVEFTNRGAANYATEATDGIVDVNFLADDINQTITLKGVTNFYRIEIDKGTDDTYILDIISGDPSYFNLFGYANEGHGSTEQLTENNNALGLINGTVIIGENVSIAQLNTGSNFNISKGAKLWVDGGSVTKSNGTAIVPYGKVLVSNGSLTSDVGSGITTRSQGSLEVTGGIVNMRQFRTSTEGNSNIGGYIQRGGIVNITGGSINSDYYLLSLTYPDNVFIMSGGTLTINGTTSFKDNTAGNSGQIHGGAIFINSNPGNINVTGGEVIMDINTNHPYRVTSKAPFYNVTMQYTSGTTTEIDLEGGTSGDDDPGDFSTLVGQELVVLNNLTIGDGVLLDHNGLDVTIGGDFVIESNGGYVFDDVNKPNTTTFNGTKSATLNLQNKVGGGANVWDDEQQFYNLTLSKTNGARLTLDANTLKDTEIAGSTNPDANNLVYVENLLRVESGTFDLEEYSLRVFGASVYIYDTLCVYESGVSNPDAMVKFRTGDVDIYSDENAVIGNFRVRSNTNMVTLHDDLVVGRVQYQSGRMDIQHHNLRIDEFDLDFKTTEANFGGCGGCFSSEDMFITDGNASDGGITFYVPAGTADGTSFLFPFGVSGKYTPANLTISAVSDDGYITINPVQGELGTTELLGGDLLDYYWKLNHSDFDTLPTIDQLDFYYDDTDVVGTEANYVAGKVQDENLFTRSYEDEDIPESEGVDIGNNIITFNGQGDIGFTLENANYTAGETNRFTGSPTVYYSRATNGSWWEWQETDHWSTDTTNKHIGPPAGTIPGAGDIVVIGSEYVNSLTGGSYSKTGDGRHQIRIDGSHGDVNVAQIIFDSKAGGTALSVTDMSRIRVRKGISLESFLITGKGELVQDVGPNASDFGTITADIGDFANDPDNGWFFWIQATGTTVVTDYSKYPVFRTFGGTNKDFQFGIDVEAEYAVIDNNTTLQIANNLTINNQLLIGSNNPGNVEFIDVGSNKTLEVGSIIFDDVGNNTLTVENSGSDTHILKVNSDIIIDGGSTFDLTSDAGSNVNLYLSNSGTHSLTNNAGITLDLYRIIMNKGTDTTSTFTFNSEFTLSGSTNGSEKALELQAGNLILNHSGIDIDLTTGGDDFNIPQGSGLEVQDGSVNASGSGIYLDGLLHINGGTANFDDASTYIEYSASGNAILDIDAGVFTLGNQIRRGLGSDAGVLKFRQSGGTVLIGNQSVSESSRSTFEIVNTGSEFTHTGGDFTIVRQNGSNPSIAALYLQPDTYDLNGSTITLGNSSTPTGQNKFGVNSTIPLNNLIINGDNEPTINMNVNPLTIDGDLTIENDGGDLGSLNADGLTLTINGNFTNNGNFIPNGNTTIFSGSSPQLLSGSGTSEFYNFEKTNSETLTIGMDITINNLLDLDEGTFHTDIYSADVKGNVINDGLHTSTSGNGIVFSGNSLQQLLRSSIGTSTFGIITINNTSGVEIPDGNGYFFTISDNLRLQNGVLNIGNSLLTIDTNAGIEEVNTFSSNNMIQTNSSFTDYGVMKVFPTISSPTSFIFPVGESKYTPITLDITTSSAGSITIRPADEIHPSILEDDEFTLSGGADPNIVDADNVLQYHWILRGSGISGFNGTATFEYDSNDTEVTAPYSLTNYIPARLLSSGTTWDKAYSQANFDESNHEIIFPFSNANDDGLTGEYTAGVGVDGSDVAIYGAIPDVVPEYETNQAGGGDYDNGATWNTAIPVDGPLGAIITVKNGDVLRINNDNIRLLKTIIEDGGVLEIDGTIGHRLGTVEGTGTIRLVSNTTSAVLPAGYFGDFFTCGGGGIEYDGTGSYDVLAGINTLEDLTFSGSGTRTLPNNDINVCNNLVINGSVSVDNASDRNINIQNDFSLNQTSEFITGSANVNLQGNLNLASTAILNSSTGNNFTLDGSSDQTLTGVFSGHQLSEFYDLTINKAGGKVFLNEGDTIEVDRTLNLTNGIFSLGTTGIMVMDTLGTYTGASANSFVDGYFAKENLSTSFTFPVGYQTSFNPISVESPTSGYWETRFRMEDPTTNGTIDNLDPDPSLLGTYPDFEVPGDEYWELTGPSPGTATVEIGWNQYSNISDYTQLFEMQWSDADSHWDAISNAPSGNNTTGTIKSTSAVSFSTQYFTLGSGTIVILPVELVDFSGKKFDDFVEISWQTIVEQNTDFFEIERAQDGINFTKIGETLAKGNSDQLNKYIFDDLRPHSGINYYRLKMVDKDGNFEYSKVISVNVVNDNQGILAYPNPITNHHVNLSLWGFQQNSRVGIKIMDLMGKTVFSKFHENNSGTNFQIELELPSLLQTGIYQLLVNDGSKTFNQKVLIK
ncbi:T9SS type A sorting domain-containing protein [Flexithrix dorotheae]|uniref:T9SS type A sorting domain-containing protein n=1 Tax=Flexithrix dorotheae TaxID=70993 RepID=UPI00039E9BFF|nr:T9SS type A sorting domain-containing protein [Flexithrix dorotheae]